MRRKKAAQSGQNGEATKAKVAGEAMLTRAFGTPGLRSPSVFAGLSVQPYRFDQFAPAKQRSRMGHRSLRHVEGFCREAAVDCYMVTN